MKRPDTTKHLLKGAAIIFTDNCLPKAKLGEVLFIKRVFPLWADVSIYTKDLIQVSPGLSFEDLEEDTRFAYKNETKLLKASKED